MPTDLEYLSQNLYCIRSELLEPIITVHSAYKLLIGKVPETVTEILDQIGKISENVLSELHTFPENKIDLQSPDNAFKQLRSLANKWEKDTEDLSLLANKVKTMDVHLEDDDLERILKEIISNGIQKFRSYIQDMDLVQAEHLVQDNGFAKILKIDIPK